MAVSVFATLLGLFMIAGIVEGDDPSPKLDSLTGRVNDIERRLDKMAEQLRMFEDNLRVVRAERCQNCLQGPICPIGVPGRQGMPGMPGPSGLPGMPGRKGEAFEWENSGEFCLVIIGDSCPNGFVSNQNYNRQLRSSIPTSTLNYRSCCK